MDRQIVYPGSIPLDTDILNLERSTMVAIGYLAQCALGTNTVADGLLCTCTSPGSMTINVGPGSITQYGVVDNEAFGSLPADTNDSLLKVGINLTATPFTLTAPTTSGQSVNYLIEASFLEVDTNPVVLPYYNSANPSIPYSGPNNSGAPQNTQRLQRVQFQLKSGAPSGSGTQMTPSVDAGWVGLYVVTVQNGQTTIVPSNIQMLPSAPFLTWKLPQLSPGTHRLAAFTPASEGDWVVPAGVFTAKMRVWGGGGAGGSGFAGGGGGGAGGGYAEGCFSVAPGQSYFVTVGGGGVGQGTSGGNSSVGSLVSASGGAAGASGGSGTGGAGGAAGGIGSGAAMVSAGQPGGTAFAAGSLWVSGRGGASIGSGGAEATVASNSSNAVGASALLPGAGGAGGVGTGVGGQGGSGLVLIEY